MHFLQPQHRAIALPEASRMARLVAGVNNLLFRDWIPFVICLITLMGMADSNNRALQIAGLTTALGYIATLLLMVPRNLYAQSGKLVLVNRNIYAMGGAAAAKGHGLPSSDLALPAQCRHRAATATRRDAAQGQNRVHRSRGRQ